MANRKFITEILDEINEDPSKIAQYKDHIGLKIIFDYAFNPTKKFDLPEGIPPFKNDAAPIGMSPGNLMMELRRLYIFTAERNLQKVRRETLFIQLLESLHPSEAKLMCFVKDQTLPKAYSKITAQLLVDNGFLSEEYLPKKSVEAPVVEVQQDSKPVAPEQVAEVQQPKEVKPKAPSKPRTVKPKVVKEKDVTPQKVS